MRDTTCLPVPLRILLWFRRIFEFFLRTSFCFQVENLICFDLTWFSLDWIDSSSSNFHEVLCMLLFRFVGVVRSNCGLSLFFSNFRTSKISYFDFFCFFSLLLTNCFFYFFLVFCFLLFNQGFWRKTKWNIRRYLYAYRALKLELLFALLCFVLSTHTLTRLDDSFELK